jgi:hypothetical protein
MMPPLKDLSSLSRAGRDPDLGPITFVWKSVLLALNLLLAFSLETISNEEAFESSEIYQEILI